MKKKIEDALRTEFTGLGLSDKTIGRLADYLMGSVEKEEDIATAVKRDDVALIAKSIQGEVDGLQKAKKTAEDALADYKAKHPEVEPPTPPTPPSPPTGNPDVTKLVNDAVAAAKAEFTKALEDFKSQTSAKEAKAQAKDTFFGNKWTEKFKDEANDAWERANELNDAQGGKMTSEELSSKASSYFNAYVLRKGVDATQPFKSEGAGDEVPDFSETREFLEKEGLLEPETK